MLRQIIVGLLAVSLAKACGSIPGHAVTLTWHAATVPNGAAPVTGYNVYRSPHAKNTYMLLNPAGMPGLAFVDTSVVAGVAYDYYETAENSVGESKPSNVETVIIP